MMRPLGVYLVLCGYIAGLLVPVSWPFGLAWLLAGWIAGAIVPRLWKGGPRSLTWVCVGIAAFLAGIYFQVRQPLPEATDVSYLAARVPRDATVRVAGTLVERPQLTRSDRARFRFAVDRVRWQDEGEATERTVEASGRLYVTMPLLQVTGLGADDRAELLGRLYLPSVPTNPGQFDFQTFLAKDGIWAGLVGESIDWETVEDRSSWLEAIRQRIVRSHVEGLGVPSGLLMSAMTLGRWSVDLPYALRDRFTDLGLAHVLAASGFHVGIVLSNVLRVVGGSPKLQFGAGSVTLLLYSALAGFQPSVCRAAFMGWAGVLGNVLGRRVRSSGTLLAIATLLLLWDPLLVGDLGFQLSFLATFGLIVATEPIARLLAAVLPMGWAQAMSVPVAATIWTLPLQVYIFNTFSPIAIPINLLAGELAGLVTTVGFFSGVAATIVPWLGSAIARGLAYPMHGMLIGLEWVHDRIGRPWFVQQIAIWQVAALYGVAIALWLWGARAERGADLPDEASEASARPTARANARRLAIGGAALAVCVAIVFAPTYWQTRDAIRVFVLDEPDAPTVVVRDRGITGLIGESRDAETLAFTLLPVFRSLGVNALALAIDPGVESRADRADASMADASIVDRLAVAEFLGRADFADFTEASRGSIALGRLQLEPLDRDGNLLLRTPDRVWAVLSETSEATIAALLETRADIKIDVVCWSGEALPVELWQRWQPSTAIAVDRLDADTATLLGTRGIEPWETRRGAIVGRDGRIERAIRDRLQTDWSL